MGRPTKYSQKLVDKICALIEADTYTVAEICRMVKIDRSTYFDWLNTKPDFSDAIKKAQETRTAFFVAEAKKSLLKKIQGYTVQEKHTTTVGSGKFDVNGVEKPKIKEQKTVDKHFQPDTAAIIFTLCNGEPENWKNRQNTEVTGKDGKDLFGKYTDDELDAKIADLENRLKQ
ncbi:MAG: hypothetical protein LBQ22_05615 [Bacteroidales bacterium]|jgi:hypothetical protein|nr:hypothetical protein [Bacteroidales bacterium]